MDWWVLYQFINVGLNDIRGALGALNRAVAAVWSYVGGLWSEFMVQINAREAAHFRYTTSVLQTCLAIRDALLHIIRDQIPLWIASATTDVVNWAHLRINNLRTELLSLITAVQRWAEGRLNATDARLTSISNWLNTRLSTAEGILARTTAIVNDRLTNPNRLAEWAIDAFVRAAQRWFWANLDRLAGALFKNLIAFAIRSILLIEQLIARFI